MSHYRLRSVRHPGDRKKRVLVTEVYCGSTILGANVWGRDEAVYVRGKDLERVGRELLALAERRKRQ